MPDDWLVVESDHPALPGHFPGRPIVPGAVLLDRAMSIVERRLDCRIDRVVMAKFPNTLLPGTHCTIRFEESAGHQVHVHCSVREKPVLVATFQTVAGGAG